MRHVVVTIAALLLFGCAQLPPTPEDLQAKRFEAVPDKAVIYVVRQPMDSWEPGGLLIDTGETVTLFPQTYYRWEVAPGSRRIEGTGPWNVSLTLDVQPGRIYFLRHTVFGTRRTGPTLGALSPVGEELGRQLVMRSEMVR
jgi:hypothetical protein